MIETFPLTMPDLREGCKELKLLSIIAQSFVQPFSLEDNLLLILTALTAGSGVGFNRAMLLLVDEDRLRGEMWLGPRSSDEAQRIWEVLSLPGIGYREIIEHNRALLARDEDTLNRRIRGLSYDLDETDGRVPAGPVRTKALTLVRQAAAEPRVDPRFRELIGVDEFLCVPLLAREDVMGLVVVDNAITRAPIEAEDMKLAGVCGLIAGSYIHTTRLHGRVVEMEKMAAMGELTMFVTHQIRNPVAAIGGFSEQLLDGRLDDARKERNLRLIREEIERLEKIIDEMGRLLRVTMQEPVFFDVRPVLEEVLASPDIVEKARARGVTVTARVSKCPPRVLCDPTSTGEAFRNLLDNALDATPPGGVITVRAFRRSRRWFAVSVRDTGSGMTVTEKARLFQPFFTTKVKGMGLGVSFIKRVMDACGGRIEVRSRIGQGTLFQLYFQIENAR